ncbi:hypothetical protein FHS18_006472 [Paenibacillus phyllosphaerae]|uniref:Secreted protein n=1 Tax=Paenibacillus phyllosphaerae TaxID=274593 RepID=A0A7W5B644_9BACL|nr:hypothetical protein [Paenibacillus phyllosphaerae]MBB3114351.1 hypothetical protein [Paenibacillus phyllosphaerae]
MNRSWITIAIIATSVAGTSLLLERMSRTEAASDLSDPYLDPYAMTMSHQHAGAESETEAEKRIGLSVNWPDGTPQAGQPQRLRLTFADQNAGPIEHFEIVNEKQLHLIVVSHDLAQFQHVHPEYKGNGVFELPITLESGGDYKLFSDFKPMGLNELTRSADFTVAGTPEPAVPLEASKTLTATVEGMRIELEFGQQPMAQMATTMTYSLFDASTGDPITDLELYLGSVGHVVAIDETASDFIHVHPLNWAATGPQAVFAITFPKSGMYKLWGQFQRDGKVFVVPFTVQI